jgi:hypothetical protein
MNAAIFWDISPCSPYGNRRFGGIYHNHTQCRAARWFLARMIFDPEDGGDMFLRNVGSYTDGKRIK